MFEIKKLKVLAARLNRVAHNINKGGCCVIASLVAPFLIQHNIQTRICVLSSESDGSIDGARSDIASNCVEDWNDHGVYFSHILLELQVNNKTFYFDSTGLHTKINVSNYYLERLDGELTLEEAKELADDSSGWNSTFDRSDIPALTESIIHFFTNSIKLPLENLQMAEIRMFHSHHAELMQ